MDDLWRILTRTAVSCVGGDCADRGSIDRSKARQIDHSIGPTAAGWRWIFAFCVYTAPLETALIIIIATCSPHRATEIFLTPEINGTAAEALTGNQYFFAQTPVTDLILTTLVIILADGLPIASTGHHVQDIGTSVGLLGVLSAIAIDKDENIFAFVRNELEGTGVVARIIHRVVACGFRPTFATG